ncbi:hypothetical protein [Catellatospora chokoriensis]|uniref:Acyl-CoA dehydrogenase-like protein n=1 Tax=Catellatospora chokoriensis TaxID=310353 RepID=A0A8J3K1I3_9ACTN|nr:hypothetical protein [Catellatospora chokoriensis]GIF87724.1 hypothetical protein Cch02nite_11680 [Catellatospora chokoriensis]
MAEVFAQRAAELGETAQLPWENLRESHEAGFGAAWLPQRFGDRGLSAVLGGRFHRPAGAHWPGRLAR